MSVELLYGLQDRLGSELSASETRSEQIFRKFAKRRNPFGKLTNMMEFFIRFLWEQGYSRSPAGWVACDCDSGGRVFTDIHLGATVHPKVLLGLVVHKA